MNDRRKSDRPIVPGKPSNKARAASGSAETVEERGLAKGNLLQLTRDRILSRGALSSGLERIRQVLMPARHLPRQEPSAGNLRAGICTGGPGQPGSLP